MTKRRFGRVRRLPSGRYQARYPGPDGVDRPAPETFATKGEADVWLVKTEAEILSDDWINPDAAKVPFGEYANDWISERPDLRPKTVVLYRYLLRRHLNPTFETRAIGEIKEPQIRKWRKELLDNGVSEVTTAKAYRLLKAVFATAADDGALKRNPCRIKGAGQEESAERPVLTIAQVYAVAQAAGQRYQALILLAMFTSLRWGELAGLRRWRPRPGRQNCPGDPPAHRNQRPGNRVRPAQVQGGPAHRPHPGPDNPGHPLAPDLLRPGRRRGPGLHQPAWPSAAAQPVPSARLATSAQGGRTG